MITPPLIFSRRFYKEKEEEVIISSCNYCLAVIAESRDEAELERRERQHKCAARVQASAA